ncbi:hypothetical protein RND81_13G158900 [Saponaria officinalis]|uniref:Uncharacterized protein n=1 Tax=Saponaria officinalis TaxID=3572 RepID=A0AAW1H3W9_SAPOF
MKTFVITTTCVFLVIVMVQAAPTPPTPTPPPAIPPSKLAFQWPVTLCAAKPCKELKGKVPPPELFRLHGLWPTNSDWTISLSGCPGVNFTANPIDDIRPALRQYWPSYLEPENGFWRHEWESHGMCSNLPPRQFFEKGLQLARLHSKALLPALAKSKIKLGTSSTPLGIRDAILQGMGVSCQLKCFEDAGKQYGLQEIYLCLDPNFDLHNCTDKGWLQGCGPYKDDKKTRVNIPINRA